MADRLEKAEQTYKATLLYSYNEGKEDGALTGKRDMARELKQRGIETRIIAESSGLTEKEIEEL